MYDLTNCLCDVGHTTHHPYLSPARLDFRVGCYHVQDQFVWDLANESASPERFAYAFCGEVGLAPEVACRMAWHIRNQVVIAVIACS